MIVPSLQLYRGRAMALRPGGTYQELPDDPVDLGGTLYRYGEISVVDLDAARGEGDNLELVRRICRVAEARVGGGIREEKQGDALLRAGARRLLIGTHADPTLLMAFPRSKVLVAIDVRDGRVVRGERQEATDVDPVTRALELAQDCSGFVISLVGHSGRIGGSDVEQLEAIRARLPDHSLAVAGGVRSPGDVRDLDRSGIDVLVAVGEDHGIGEMADGLAALVRFEQSGGLVPVIVQDTAGQVIALHQSNEEAFRLTLQSGKGTYWSRMRGGIWTKGEVSGRTHQVLTVRPSASRDALLYQVRVEGTREPGERYSQFDEISYNLFRIEDVLRRRQGQSDPRKSYTSIMLADREGVRQRIRQEARALSQATLQEEVLWETADLLYFVLLNLVQEGISLQDVIRELRGRAGRRRR